MALVGLIALTGVGAPSSSGAQIPDSLVLRPEPRWRPLAQSVASIVQRRSPGLVRVGEAPAEAGVPLVPGDILIETPSRARMVEVRLIVDPDRQLRTQVRLAARPGIADARAVALAIESLLDAAAASVPATRPAPGETPPEPVAARRRPEGGARWRRYTLLFADALRAPSRPPDPLARPSFSLRLHVGFSPVRSRLLVGPGLGVGLCPGNGCFVFEGDLPLVPERTRARDGRTVRYRPVHLGARAQWWPAERGPLFLGATGGLLSRIGAASVEGTEARRTVSNLAFRATLEAGWRVRPPVEIVAEVGVDFAVHRARFVRFGESVLLEDRWTPWLVLSTRLRPDPRPPP
ncbi:MAG: hypothetical protein RMK74_14665 [Myxococcales bacterium]|nr:hypothetical protein [Myxococcales bacterium]